MILLTTKKNCSELHIHSPKSCNYLFWSKKKKCSSLFVDLHGTNKIVIILALILPFPVCVSPFLGGNLYCCPHLFDADNPVYNSQGVCYNSKWDIDPDKAGKLDSVLIISIVKNRNAPSEFIFAIDNIKIKLFGSGLVVLLV